MEAKSVQNPKVIFGPDTLFFCCVFVCIYILLSCGVRQSIYRYMRIDVYGFSKVLTLAVNQTRNDDITIDRYCDDG